MTQCCSSLQKMWRESFFQSSRCLINYCRMLFLLLVGKINCFFVFVFVFIKYDFVKMISLKLDIFSHPLASIKFLLCTLLVRSHHDTLIKNSWVEQNESTRGVCSLIKADVVCLVSHVMTVDLRVSSLFKSNSETSAYHLWCVYAGHYA